MNPFYSTHNHNGPRQFPGYLNFSPKITQLQRLLNALSTANKITHVVPHNSLKPLQRGVGGQQRAQLPHTRVAARADYAAEEVQERQVMRAPYPKSAPGAQLKMITYLRCVSVGSLAARRGSAWATVSSVYDISAEQ